MKQINRICGDCNLCCKLMGINELKKPEFTWCDNAEPGKGCRIYNHKPHECKRFNCLWIKGYMTDEQRPDKIGIVVIYDFVLAKAVFMEDKKGEGKTIKLFGDAIRFLLGSQFAIEIINKKERKFIEP